MTLGEIITQRKDRWIRFFESGSPRILFVVNIQNETPTRPLPHPDKKDDRINWAWEKYNKMIENLNWLEDDSIPYLDIYTGTEIFAEAFGCKVHRPDTDMPFALPKVSSFHEANKIQIPELGSSPLMLLFEVAESLRFKAGEDALVRMVDTQGPMDITALIWDKNSFYRSLLEAPDAVKELCKKVKNFEINFLDTWFNRFGREFIAHYPEYYMPFGITLSEDEIGVVSREMFDEFFLPELVDLSDHFGLMGLHCCAHAKHQWNNLKKIPNLKLLNLVQPEKILTEAFSFYAPICAQMHSWSGNGEPWTWPKQLPENARVVMQIDVDTKEKAYEVTSRLRELLE